ncbi:MAG: PEP-CTERM sorting domain-containing protein [Leptolyngbya sp.]|nr:PEP-CTERM sorting domain-containing protein [Leptolyngbya sp.]
MTFPQRNLQVRATVAATALLTLGIVGSALTTPSAYAADFVLDFQTDAHGNLLDANALDTHGNGDRVDIGTLWSDIGITITGSPKQGNAPLGLFNSNCKPFDDGISLSGFTQACGTSTSNGDDDLATGEGYYDQDRNGAFSYDINGNGTIQRNQERFRYYYNTAPQGNVLIFEENPGNGTPDDTSIGGDIFFNFDRSKLSKVVIESIGIIDDAKGELFVEYMDGSTFSETIDIRNENELKFFNPAQKDVKNFLVRFNGSGAVTGVTFAEFKEAPVPVPEPTGLLGLALAGGFGVRTLRKRQPQSR